MDCLKRQSCRDADSKYRPCPLLKELVGERKNAEEALRRSEAYLAEAQRLSHTGTLAFNATGPLYWSEESYRIWGFDPLQGLPNRETVLQRIHPDDRERADVETEEVVRQKRDFVLGFRIVLPDGTIKHIVSTGHPLFSADGELVEMVATHVDVSERKRAQQEHERLRQLESDLAHVNRLSIMGELTASLAHEILHPIATARNNARAAMRFLDMSPPKMAEVMETLACIVRDADRGKAIVDRIREHVKKAPPRNDRFDINEAIEDVIEMVRAPIDKNGVSVRTRLAAGLNSVWGDRVQLQQVVLNLILNAVEAMESVEERGRKLSIRTEQKGAADILVAVHDSGSGIDPECLQRVFDSFYTTKPSGLGMGLSICRSIIDAHGGRLWAEADRPRGTVFQFRLPAQSKLFHSPDVHGRERGTRRQHRGGPDRGTAPQTSRGGIRAKSPSAPFTARPPLTYAASPVRDRAICFISGAVPSCPVQRRERTISLQREEDRGPKS